jgi:hypothetical protein
MTDTSISTLVAALSLADPQNAVAECNAIQAAITGVQDAEGACGEFVEAGGPSTLAAIIDASTSAAAVSAACTCAECVISTASGTCLSSFAELSRPTGRVLERFLNSAEACEAACSLLTVLSGNESVTFAAHALVAALGAHPSVASLVEASCSALACAASDSAGQKAVATAGGVKAINSVLDTLISDAAAAEQASAVLCAVAALPSNHELMLQDAAVGTLTTILAVHTADVAVATNACAALLNLGENGTASENMSTTDGCTAAVASVLSLHSASGDSVAVSACRILARICNCSAQKMAVSNACEQPGFAQALIAILLQHGTDRNLVVAACTVFQSYVSDAPAPHMRACEVVQLGGVSAIVSALKMHAGRVSAASALVGVLHALVVTDSSAVEAVISGGGLPVLVAVLEAHGQATISIALDISAMLSTLSIDDGLRVAVGALGGITALLRCMQAHPSVADVQVWSPLFCVVCVYTLDFYSCM